MFTGIISAVEQIQKVESTPDLMTVRIGLPKTWKLEIGESISISGVCSTVIEITETAFTVQYMPETLRLTWFSSLQEGDWVNIERSMTPTDLLSGYIVSGHVEDIGIVESIEKDGEDSWVIRIRYPEQAAKYFIHKGGVTVDGIALTVNEPTAKDFGVAIIPHTFTATTIQAWKPGKKVHLEYDMIAKYVDRMMTLREESKK